VTNLKQAGLIFAGFLIVLGAGSLTGCSTLASLLTNPTIIQDIVGGVVAILEDTGTSEAAINAQAVAALAGASSATMTVTQLETTLEALPGFGAAVSSWVADNPELAQTEAGLADWLQALVAATTPLTAAEANVKLRLQARHMRAARKVGEALRSSDPLDANGVVRLPDVVVCPRRPATPCTPTSGRLKPHQAAGEYQAARRAGRADETCGLRAASLDWTFEARAARRAAHSPAAGGCWAYAQPVSMSRIMKLVGIASMV